MKMEVIKCLEEMELDLWEKGRPLVEGLDLAEKVKPLTRVPALVAGWVKEEALPVREEEVEDRPEEVVLVKAEEKEILKQEINCKKI